MNQPEQQQEVPGIRSQMTPVPDCGESSYEGSGQLEGKVAVISGGDSGVDRAVLLASDAGARIAVTGGRPIL
ncbi:MAG TPA: hypothetical protein VIT41_01695 [Microlunatus sp.]